MQNLSLDLMSVLGFGIYLGVGNTSDMIMMAFFITDVYDLTLACF